MKHMKLIVLLLASVSLSGCVLSHFSSGIAGSGKLVTTSRPQTGFNKIVNRGPANVQVTSGQDYSIKVTVDDNLEKHVKVTVSGDELIISNDQSINPTSCKVVITMPNISAFRIDGAGDATVNAVSSSSFDGKIEGAGSLTLSGKATSAKLSIQGAGDIHAYDLKADSATASIEGAGSIEVYAGKELTAEIDGAGDIRYQGDPKVKSSIDGAGSIRKD